MSTQLKLRRGTTAQHSTFTGASGEITVDTTKKTVVVHDGSTAGGVPLAKESDVAGFLTSATAASTYAPLASPTFSGSITASSGTANGVAYLNGSKVLTTGSALTFDGTNLGVGGSPSTYNGKLVVKASDQAVIGYFGGTTYAARIGANASYAVIEGVDAATGVSSYQPLQIGGSLLKFDVSGSEQMRLTSTGLGIGTTSPGYKLDVRGTGTFEGASGIGALRIAGAGGSWFWIDNPTATTLRFSSGATAGTNPMTFDSSGNLGIGTSSPATKLHLSTGVAEFAVAWEKTGSKQWVLGSFAGGAYIQNATDSKRHLQFLDTGETLVIASGSERMRIDSSGNVGIGTSSPGTKLNVYTGSATTTLIRPQNTLAFADFGPISDGTVYGPYSAPAESTSLTIGTSNSNPIKLYTNGSERMRIAATGETIVKAALQETKTAIAASAIDLSTGNYFTKTISGATTFTVSSVPASGTVGAFILELTNGGSATVTWFSGVKWASGTAPTLTASGVDVIAFYTHDGGTTWRGAVVSKDSK